MSGSCATRKRELTELLAVIFVAFNCPTVAFVLVIVPVVKDVSNASISALIFIP